MKKSLVFSLAAASLLASCSDEMITSVETASQDGVQGKLVKAGLLSGARVNETGTRGYSQAGRFVWMPEVGTTGEVTNGYLQLGLCWTGVNNANSELGARDKANENVYTNYLFEHVGWLDVDAERPEVDECSAQFIDNGAFINGFTLAGHTLPYADFAGTLTGSRENKYFYADSKAEGALGKYDSEAKSLNLGSGLFYTRNSSVFEGEYLVYFPYTNAFTSGQIVAWEPKSYAYDQAVDMYQNIDKYTFAIGQIEQYEGGNQSEMFRTANLAGFANIRIYSDATSGTTNIKQAILYSKSQGIIFEQKVDASKAVAAIKAGSLSKNILTAGTEAKSNTVFATLSNGLADYATVTASATSTAANTNVKVILPVLPQTVSDLEVILIAENGTSIRKDVVNKDFAPNASNNIDINLNGETWKNEFYVVDEETFNAAFKACNALGGGVIKVLNDFDINGIAPQYGSYNFTNNIEVTSECEGVQITFKAQSGYIKEYSVFAQNDDKTMSFASNVDLLVEGMGCCGDKPARLLLGKDVAANETIKVLGTLTNNGQTSIQSEEGSIEINELQNVFDKWAISKEKNIDCAVLVITDADVEEEVSIETLNNEGMMMVIPTTTTAPRQLTVNVETLTNTGILDKTAAAAGKLTNPANLAGGMIGVGQGAIVNVTDLNNTNMYSMIQVGQNSGESTKEGRIDISGSSVNNGTIDNGGVMNFDNSLDNNGIFIDQQNAQVGISRVNCETAPLDNDAVITRYYAGVEKTEYKYETDRATEGIYVARVNTVGRMAFVVSDAVVSKSAQVIEITDLAANITFDVADMAQDLQKYDVRVDDDTYTVTFNSNDGTDNVEGYFANCLDVIKGDVILTKGLLKAKNVKLEENTTLTANGSKCEVTIDNDLTVEKNALADINNKSLTVGNNTKVAGEFNSDAASVYTMKNVDVTVDGTFDSNGDKNTVTGNFATAGTTTFAPKTSTIINGNFAATDGTFEREELVHDPGSRATVNVDGSISHTGATTTTAWPTSTK